MQDIGLAGLRYELEVLGTATGEEQKGEGGKAQVRRQKRNMLCTPRRSPLRLLDLKLAV